METRSHYSIKPRGLKATFDPRLKGHSAYNYLRILKSRCNGTELGYLRILNLRINLNVSS